MLLKTNTITSCTYTSSGDYSTYTKNKAWDGNSATYWVSTTNTSPKWVAVTLPSRKKILHYGIKIKDIGTTYTIAKNAPKTWQFQVKIGLDWVTMDTVSNYTGFVNNVESIFTLNELEGSTNYGRPIAGSEYRLYVWEQNGTTNTVMITDINLYDDIDYVNCEGGIVFSSGVQMGSQESVFSDTFSNYWLSTAVAPSTDLWIRVDLPKRTAFPNGYGITSYGITVATWLPNLAGTEPISWVLQASGTTTYGWENIHTVTNFDYTKFEDYKEIKFLVDKKIYATNFRLLIISTNIRVVNDIPLYGTKQVSLCGITLYEQKNYGNLTGVDTMYINGLPKNVIRWIPETKLTYTTLQVIKRVGTSETVIGSYPYADRLLRTFCIDSGSTITTTTTTAAPISTTTTTANINIDITYYIKLVGCVDGQTHESVRFAPSRVISKTTVGSNYNYVIKNEKIQPSGGVGYAVFIGNNNNILFGISSGSTENISSVISQEILLTKKVVAETITITSPISIPISLASPNKRYPTVQGDGTTIEYKYGDPRSDTWEIDGYMTVVYLWGFNAPFFTGNENYISVRRVYDFSSTYAPTVPNDNEAYDANNPNVTWTYDPITRQWTTDDYGDGSGGGGCSIGLATIDVHGNLVYECLVQANKIN
jgi:hypothetical protein